MQRFPEKSNSVFESFLAETQRFPEKSKPVFDNFSRRDAETQRFPESLSPVFLRVFLAETQRCRHAEMQRFPETGLADASCIFGSEAFPKFPALLLSCVLLSEVS